VAAAPGRGAPLRLTGRGSARAGTTIEPVELIFSVIQVFISIVLIFLVLMHSGKDAGLSGAFGVGTGQGPLGGGSLVERNLNRWTIGFAIAFAINTIILLKKPFW
jgi:preprotein translocase subunit SecG